MGQRVKNGDVMEIYLDGWYYYAQQETRSITRFIDFRSKDPVTDYSTLPFDKSMFDILVYRDVLSSGVWKIVARKMPIPSNIPKYLYVHLDDYLPDFWQRYCLETDELTVSSEEECAGLERFAVWPQWKVEERILKYFANK